MNIVSLALYILNIEFKNCYFFVLQIGRKTLFSQNNTLIRIRLFLVNVDSKIFENVVKILYSTLEVKPFFMYS